jgi:hypothetical protein
MPRGNDSLPNMAKLARNRKHDAGEPADIERAIFDQEWIVLDRDQADGGAAENYKELTDH